MKAQTAKRLSRPAINLVRAPSLAHIPWLIHGFSTRGGGGSKIYGGNALNLGFTKDDSRSAVEANRRLFAATLVDASKGNSGQKYIASKSSRWPLVTVRQIHSDIIHHVSEPPHEPLAGDGMITSVPGILLAVLAADCFPVVLVDPKKKAVGVFHAGWRGTAKRIVQKGVGEMNRWFGTKPSDVRAAIGPGNRDCCYEVGPEVRSIFESQFSYADKLFRETKERDEIHEKYPLLFLTARAPGHSELPKKIFLNLADANRRQLLEAGVPAKNISDVGLCTSCDSNQFFSHRAENGKTGRMMAAVGIRA